MEKWFIKSFKQGKTNFMFFLRKRISPEQIIERNWSYKIQVFKIAAKAEKDKIQKQSQWMKNNSTGVFTGSPISGCTCCHHNII